MGYAESAKLVSWRLFRNNIVPRGWLGLEGPSEGLLFPFSFGHFRAPPKPRHQPRSIISGHLKLPPTNRIRYFYGQIFRIRRRLKRVRNCDLSTPLNSPFDLFPPNTRHKRSETPQEMTVLNRHYNSQGHCGTQPWTRMLSRDSR